MTRLGGLRLVWRAGALGLWLVFSIVGPVDAARRRIAPPTPAYMRIYVDGTTIRSPALVVRGRALVPVRGVFSAIGADVSFSTPHFIVVRKDGAVIAAFILGRRHAIIGHRAVELDSPPVYRNARIYVPLRVVAQAAGATVVYGRRPPVIWIRGRVKTSHTDVPPIDPKLARAALAAEESQRASLRRWQEGVALFTGLCCLTCLVLMIRRLLRGRHTTPAKRPAPVLERHVAQPAPPVADSVALTSVEASGEARFHKQIVTETRTIEVPVTREELVIEYAGEGGTVIIEGRPLEPGETVRIPLWEERVHVDVTKHVLLTEDIVIDKRRIVADAIRERTTSLEPDVAEGSPS